MNRDFTLLQWAVRNLETFTESNEGAEFPTISDLEVQGSVIVLPKQPRVVKLVNFIFALTMNDNSPQNDVLELLKQSIEVVHRYSNSLVELETGTAEQKDLAKRVYDVTPRVNKVIEQAQCPPKTKREKLVRKVSATRGDLSVKDLNKIQLPPQKKYLIKIPSFNISAPPLSDRIVISNENLPSNISKKVSIFATQVKTELSSQTMDMYRVKAILLLEKRGICNRIDARRAVMSLPIESKCTDELCIITQQLPTYDGPFYRIECIFSRDNPSDSKKKHSDYRIFVSCTLEIENEVNA